MILAIAYGDFALPKMRDQTLFVEALFPASPKSYVFSPSMPARVIAEPASLGYPPMYSAFLKPLETLRPAIALLIWQGVSLLALAYGVFLLGSGASKMDAAGSEMHDDGWFAFSYVPFLLALWNGTGSIAFGLFPLMVGYFAVVAKREFIGGFVLALCFVDPYLLVPVATLCAALLARKRLSCPVGVVMGLAFWIGINYWAAPAAFTHWLQVQMPQTVVQFDPAVNLPWVLSNLPQAMTMMIPLQNQPALVQLVWLGAAVLAMIGVWQILELVKNTKEKFNMAPMSFITGLYMIPLVVPGLHYVELSCLLVMGLIIFSLEWRQATDWRLKSLVRVSAIAINAYGAFLYFKPEFALPILLPLALLILFRRLIESIHLAAEEHHGLVRPPEIDMVD